MLSKVFEWSRTVHPAPEDDFVAKRTAVIGALVEMFSPNVERMMDCACIAAVTHAAHLFKTRLHRGGYWHVPVAEHAA
jgi:hypothetical protein